MGGDHAASSATIREQGPHANEFLNVTNSSRMPARTVGGSSRPQRADDLAIVRLFPLFWSMHPRLKPTVRCLNKRSFARASGVKNPCVAIGDLGQNGSADQARNMGNMFPLRGSWRGR